MDWRSAGLPYFSYSFYLKQLFRQPVRKVSVDAKFTCPNVDGTVAKGGCTFCDNRSFSPSRRLPKLSVRDQIDEGISRIQRRFNCDQFLAYFQPATNTYAPVERLRPLYDSALQHPQVVGLAIGTRPDCVPDDVLDLLESYAQKCFVSLEYGLQTIHNSTLDWMNRGHHHDAFEDAMRRSRNRGFEICVHVILGLPGETREMMMATAGEIVRAGVDSVKLHNLYCVENTALADQVKAGEVRLLEQDEYVSVLVDFIERLPPTMVVDRISGEAPQQFFVGPAWCLDKPRVLQAVRAEFARRGSYQGVQYERHVGCGG